MNVASGPVARVCDRMPSVADGLRVTASAPQSSATPKAAPSGSVRANGISGRAARKTAVSVTKTSAALHASGPTTRLVAPLRTDVEIELGAAGERDERRGPAC